MAEGFRIDASWLDALDHYVDGLEQDVMQAADDALGFVPQAFVDKAKTIPEWEPLSDSIQSWSDDGRLVIGVIGHDMVSQAMGLEFGDEDHPPLPLFRASDGIARQMQTRFRDTLSTRRPIIIPGVEL